ncbi:MAG: NAD(P)H-dependent glycerol-3-phosphate dehydrogenase [Firmicutes bacterium]|jgi:glycerol-3-phosphate dehydrogenase (NAD(P)+)|nr:NAD(P)H-dependent glycerol-3-phosphate dehydrogenase [Bacillota bacterium]
MRISFLGAGSWGTALAYVLSDKDYEIRMWTKEEDHYDSLVKERENVKYLPGIKLNDKIEFYNDIEKALEGTDIVVLAVPSQAVRSVLELAKKYIKENKIIVNVAKGIENGSHMRISQVVADVLPKNKYVILSGPSHAEEVSNNTPTTIVSASDDSEAAELVQDIFMTESLRIYTNPDVIGVEVGGSLKNIIALGAGISDGIGYGDNTKAALMTRGISEMSRLGEAMGGKLDTFGGLSGIGDLIVTCTSMHSRNRRCGIMLGEGLSLDEAIENIGMVVEGAYTVKAAYELSLEYDVDMPITREIYKVLYEGANAKESVLSLMNRRKKDEF